MMDRLERLSKIFGPIKEVHSTFKINAKATYYPQYVDVYIPDTAYDKQIAGMEFRGEKYTRPPDDKRDKSEDIIRSLRRSTKQIKGYVLCNKFNYFATFTFKNDRDNIDKCKSKMNSWIKNQKQRTSKFQYLIIPEFHKDGKSLHFHALLKDFDGVLKKAQNPRTKRFIKDVYVFPSYTLGFNNVKKIDQQPDTQPKIAKYLAKYITKDMPLFKGKKRYWASHGLVLPETEDNPTNWYEHIEPVWEKDFDSGTIKRFSNESIEAYNKDDTRT